MSRSIPASACTLWAPVPKCLVSPRIRTATSCGPPSGSLGLIDNAAVISRYSVRALKSTTLIRRENPARSTPEDDRRVEADHALDAEQAGQHADEHDRHGRGGQQLPGREERELARLTAPAQRLPAEKG